MPVTVRSFAKINLGLAIGPVRPDGFHELRTIYQTIALHDTIRLQVVRGRGIEVRCANPRVPRDHSNTCYRLVESAMRALGRRGRVIIEIEKRLPVQGGLGGASANAAGALLALERELKTQLPASARMPMAAEVGSDVPLFLIGGTVWGLGRGEQVYPAPDLPAMACVLAMPAVGVSTPQAFADWDRRRGSGRAARRRAESLALRTAGKLTPGAASDRMNEFGYGLSAWLSGSSRSDVFFGRAASGVPVKNGRGRAETPLLDLVRTGIENDFEQVVFPKYPELREVKSVLERAGASYASLSGSGSSLYGLFGSQPAAEKAVRTLAGQGVPAVATRTLARRQYWKKILVSGF